MSQFDRSYDAHDSNSNGNEDVEDDVDVYDGGDGGKGEGLLRLVEEALRDPGWRGL